jgi:polysaccharide transporter, PST family
MSQIPSLRRNIGALYVIQLSNYAAPLLILPWLTRMLGPGQFGRLGFCLAVSNYFILLADYGFNLSATRAIAVHADDFAARSRIFWNTMAVKVLLAAVGFLVMLTLSFVVPPFAAQRSLLELSYLTVLGAVLTPLWLFQGLERQTLLSAITVSVRLAAVPVTILMVRGPTDLFKAVGIAGCTPIIVGAISLLFIVQGHHVGTASIRFHELVETFKDGWHQFVSNLSMSLYTNTNAVLLGLVAGPAAVGFYTPADRLIQATQGLLGPINQSVYPRVCRLMHESRPDAFVLIRKLLLLIGGVGLSLSLLLFSGAPVLVKVIYGAAYHPVVPVLRWLSPLPFVIALSNVFGLHTMLPLGMQRTFSGIVMLAGVLNLITVVLLAHWFGPVGAAAAVLTTELFVTVLEAITLRRESVPIFGRAALV